ncbi:MAG: hypothetical protein ACJ8DU_00110 [Microvirga sp.]|jgi:hypothetical protein
MEITEKDVESHMPRILVLANYGNFLILWSRFELIVEVALMRELGLKPLQNSVVFASIPFEAKLCILQSLLTLDDKDSTGANLLADARQAAERNGFIHSVISEDEPFTRFKFVRREVKRNYTVSAKEIDFEAMDAHLAGFTTPFEAVEAHFGVSVPEIEAYTQEIESHPRAPAPRAKPRREARSSSGPSKRKSLPKGGRP